MNMVALRAMSQQLPCNEEEMLKIPHVTKANFDKYGKALLDITKKYAEQKEGMLLFFFILIAQKKKKKCFRFEVYKYINFSSIP